MKLLGSLRGTGELISSGPPVTVLYQLDLYQVGDHRTARGTIDGPLEALLAAGVQTAVLQAANGLHVAVTLIEMGADSADFDATGEGLELVPPLLN